MIRHARLIDGHQIAVMMQKHLKEEKQYCRKGTLKEAEKYLKYFNATVNDPSHVYLMAEKEGKVIGFAAGHSAYVDLGASGPLGMVQYLYIKKDYRNNGMGNKLAQEICKKLIDKGVTELNMTTKNDPHLINRYTKEGHLAQSGWKAVQVIYRKEVNNG